MYSRELDKSFATKGELFSALHESKKDIISLKKAEVILSKSRCNGVPYIGGLKVSNTDKGQFSDDSYYYVAVNTTNILDSHRDLHVSGIWNKSAKEQSGRNYLIQDHKFEMANVIVKKNDIEISVETIPFSLVGKSYGGFTQALIYKFKKDKVRNGVGKEWLESGDDIEASVKMQYVDIQLAMNSTDKSHEEEKAAYDKYVVEIANIKEWGGGIDYFWVVKEAKNIGESSLVLAGSNDATGVVNELTGMYDKHEPSDDTHKENDTRKEPSINYEYLLENYNK